MTTPTVIERHVTARGAALLDDRHPGWAYEIRLSLLDQAQGGTTRPDGRCCTLAQLHGSYREGADTLHFAPNGTTAKAHGFLNSVKTTYAGLTEAWKDEVRRRRGKSGTRGRR